MSSTASDTPLAAPLDDFLLDKSTSGETGHYKRNLEHAIQGFIAWYRSHTGTDPTFATVDPGDFREFARALRRGDPHLVDPSQLRGDTPSRGTVRTYYSNVAAYLGWAVDEGYLDENPAQTDRARDPLPDDDGRRSGDQQAWTPAQRDAITSYADDQVQQAFDALDLDDETASPPPGSARVTLVQALRDRALVYLFAYSGIRVGELLRDPNDDRRDGVTWGDLSLADNRLTVLSKRSQETWSDRSLPDQTIPGLERLQNVLEPPSDDWPIFPTLHKPTLYSKLRAAMHAADVDSSTIDARIGSDPTLALCDEFDVVPPSLSTTGARTLMRRLTDDADITVDDRHGYLTPHGGRRGIGEVMVREEGFAAAARLLDDTERMVRERYSHIEAKELAAVVTDAIKASTDPTTD